MFGGFDILNEQDEQMNMFICSLSISYIGHSLNIHLEYLKNVQIFPYQTYMRLMG
jgi:hypothetical protein